VTKSRKKRSAGRRGKVKTTTSAATVRKNKPGAQKGKTRTSVVLSASTASEQPTREDEAAYLETVIASGEAAPLDHNGKLPAGATHKIVEDESGNLKAVRRRFSIA